MEEARKHGNIGKEAKQKISSVHPEDAKKGSETEKKIKKSWKKSLISWWKSDKKNKQIVNPANNSQSHVSGKRKGHVSGPIYNNSTGKGPEYNKLRHPTSGPIMGLFKPTKKMEDENETPYMTLHQQSNLPGVQSYGPVYMVT